MIPTTAKQAWTAYVALVEEFGPGLSQLLPPGANTDAFEALLGHGVVLTTDARSLYSLHDGTGSPGNKLRAPLLALAPALDEYIGCLAWSADNERLGDPSRWNPRWFPIYCFGNGDYYCLVLRDDGPRPAGCIIQFTHEEKSREQPEVLWPSIFAYIADLDEDMLADLSLELED